MLVEDVMNVPVTVAPKDLPLFEAYALMQEDGIRHLPVMEDGRLVGVVTDRDLRLATSTLHPEPFAPDVSLEAVMTCNVITAAPLDPVEEAARLMRMHKIGCLPVVDEQAVAGIVTGTDLLEAVLRMTGVARPSGRLAVDLDDDGHLSDVTTAISAGGVRICAVLTYAVGPSTTRVIFRVETLDAPRVADILRGEGYNVVWPPHRG